MTSIPSSKFYCLTLYITQMNKAIDIPVYPLNHSITPKEK